MRGINGDVRVLEVDDNIDQWLVSIVNECEEGTVANSLHS